MKKDVDKKVNMLLFTRGESYDMTKKNIAESLKANKVKPDDIINIDYMQKMIWYKEEL